ncbi:MAG: prepilin peptidase [Thermodesulfobacteriota bacterium]
MIQYLTAGLVGLAFGSFLNVVITRLPRRERVWAGRSYCPRCRASIFWYDNIPFLSYLWLKGRCRFCGAPIPLRYPLVELAGGLLALVLWGRFPGSPLLIAYGPFALALLALSAIDLEHRLLPDAITLPGIGLGVGLALVLPHLSFLDAATGALLGGLFLYVVGWVYQKIKGRRGLGGGDVKLLAMIGAFLGVAALPWVVLLSAASGSIAGLALVLAQGRWRQGQWRSATIPYGPFLAAGALIYLLAGEKLVRLLG